MSITIALPRTRSLIRPAALAALALPVLVGACVPQPGHPINSAVELTVKPTSIETGAAKISQLPTRLAMTALRYHLSGVHVLS